MKRAIALAAMVIGCGQQIPTEHAAPFSPPMIRTEQSHRRITPFTCAYETKMDTWGYILECRTSLATITLDHSEQAPESAAYDGQCNERLYFEGRHAPGLEKQKEKWIDYGCNGVDAHMRWTVVEGPSHTYDRLDEMESPAPDAHVSFDAIKGWILNAEQADSKWRFRYNAQPRGEE